jgi:F0F1-type ATP synthase assembly protein I
MPIDPRAARIKIDGGQVYVTESYLMQTMRNSRRDGLIVGLMLGLVVGFFARSFFQ